MAGWWLVVATVAWLVVGLLGWLVSGGCLGSVTVYTRSFGVLGRLHSWPGLLLELCRALQMQTLAFT